MTESSLLLLALSDCAEPCWPANCRGTAAEHAIDWLLELLDGPRRREAEATLEGE